MENKSFCIYLQNVKGFLISPHCVWNQKKKLICEFVSLSSPSFACSDKLYERHISTKNHTFLIQLKNSKNCQICCKSRNVIHDNKSNNRHFLRHTTIYIFWFTLHKTLYQIIKIIDILRAAKMYFLFIKTVSNRVFYFFR